MMLQRSVYIPYIIEKFSVINKSVELSGKLNLTDIHIHAESLFCGIFNLLYDKKYKSSNILSSNYEAIDLIDRENKSVIQITAQKTKKKIEDTLEKETIKRLSEQGYSLKIFFITNDCQRMKKQKYQNPYSIDFLPETDLLSITDIMREIESSDDIDRIEAIYTFLRKELGDNIPVNKMISNLPVLLQLLAKEDLSNVNHNMKLNTYKINEKISFNHLQRIKSTTIDANKMYVGLMDRIYKKFDEQGMNKSISIFSKLTSFYEKELLNEETSNNIKIFFNIVNRTMEYIKKCDNYDPLPEDELELCVKIIVVDAFIRCKIFENPGGYDYVITD